MNPGDGNSWFCHNESLGANQSMFQDQDGGGEDVKKKITISFIYN